MDRRDKKSSEDHSTAPHTLSPDIYEGLEVKLPDDSMWRIVNAIVSGRYPEYSESFASIWTEYVRPESLRPCLSDFTERVGAFSLTGEHVCLAELSVPVEVACLGLVAAYGFIDLYHIAKQRPLGPLDIDNQFERALVLLDRMGLEFPVKQRIANIACDALRSHLSVPAKSPALVISTGIRALFKHSSDAGTALPDFITEEQADDLIRSKDFNVLVDERLDQQSIVLMYSTRPRTGKISEWPLSVRGMLWLALVSVGGHVTHEEIGELYNTSVEGVRTRVMRLSSSGSLGRLRDRIFTRSRSGKYGVRNIGWSYCWISRQADFTQSDLLTDEYKLNAAKILKKRQSYVNGTCFLSP